MRVWIVTASEPLPIDSGNQRLFRSGILANYLVREGHEVVRWASSLNHTAKKQRADRDTRVEVAPGYHIWLLHANPYQKNISLARWRNHREIARKFRTLSRQEPRPDVILASLPTLELAEEATRYGQEQHVPVMVDVRDMWPDVALFRVPAPARPLLGVLLSPLVARANRACAQAYAISGHAPGFVEWGLEHAGRAATARDRDFPFGYETHQPSADEIAAAEQYWNERGITGRGAQFTLCYSGAVSHQLEAQAVLAAARELKDRLPVRFVFCGTGDMLAAMQRKTADLPNVQFVGWVSFPHLWVLMRRASLGLVAVNSNPDFLASIPNKVTEYLAAALPIATSFTSGAVCDLLTHHECGFSYGKNPEALVRQITVLHACPTELQRLSDNAGALFERRFRADRVYPEMIRHLEGLRSEYDRLRGEA